MKIIGVGNTLVKCRRCGCIMEYEQKDICEKRVSTNTRSFGRKEYWDIKYIVCPWCGYEIEINAHHVSDL